MDKKTTRLRRAMRTRAKIRQLGVHRLCVHKTPRHIYAQVISPEGIVMAATSTLSKPFKEMGQYSGNVAAAKVIGEKIAEQALSAGVSEVAFDRSGFKFHGRIKALADAAREKGLKF